MLVMGIILFFSTLIKNSIMLLIIGIMIGYITSSAISLLNFFSTAEGVHSYMIWGMGNFGGVSLQQLPFFSLVTAAGLLITILLIKPLNALLLGTRYAENLGINIRRTRNLLLVATGLLTATTTASAARFPLSDWPCHTLPASCWEPPTITLCDLAPC